MDAQLDNLSIADLQARYGLRSRQAVYDRLKHLKLKPARGRVDADQIQKMDALHEWLSQSGAKMADYPVDIPVSGQLDTMSTSSMDVTGQLLEPPAWLQQLLQLLDGARTHFVDPLANLRLLQEVAETGWELPTSKLAPLLEVHPSHLRRMRTYRKFGFTCTKLSEKGQRAAWKVERV
jgi:hypothetical protein